LAIVKCEAYTCYNNRKGECQTGTISLADKEYYNDIGEPCGDDMCCESYISNRNWKEENPLPEGRKWRY